jgi:hypothetical protein
MIAPLVAFVLAVATGGDTNEADAVQELIRLRRRISSLEAEVTLLQQNQASRGNTSRINYVHKHTYATGDPLAAAQFAVDYLGASGPGANHHHCGATNTVTFKGTGTSASDGNDFLMHFVYNPHKPPGPVYMNATDFGLYEEHLRAKSFRNNSFDQFMDNHIGLVVDSLDPFVKRWQADSVPFVCRTWCCAAPMAQYPDRCPSYSLNRTSGCETGCYVEVPHGIIMELQCGLSSYEESLACLTLVQPDTFDLCSDKY